MSKQQHRYKQQYQQHQQRHPQHSESTSDQEEQKQKQRQQLQQDEYDPLGNLLSLQLRKPSHWNWELSTSRSCSNIALPRILLYDHTGALLLDANGSGEQTFRSTSVPDRRRKRAATANLAQSLQQARLPGAFNGLQIGKASPSPVPSPAPSPAASPTASTARQPLACSCIDLSTHELPDWQPRGSSSSRRSSSLRGVRFVEQEIEQQEEVAQQRAQVIAYPTPPSTSTLTTTANSSSSGPREKRRYRRSHSSGQRSILERFSMSRGRHSSPEYVQETLVEYGPRYFLRSSKAGTLVIRDESFSRVRQRRRRQRPCQLEGIPADNVVQAMAPHHSHALPSSRQPLPSTSDEETLDPHQSFSPRQSRLRRAERNCGKEMSPQELITVDPGNCVYRSSPCATRR